MTPVELFLAGVTALELASAAVSAMPAPKGDGAYKIIYKGAHVLVGNLDKLFKSRTGVEIPAPIDDSSPKTGA